MQTKREILKESYDAMIKAFLEELTDSDPDHPFYSSELCAELRKPHHIGDGWMYCELSLVQFDESYWTISYHDVSKKEAFVFFWDIATMKHNGYSIPTTSLNSSVSFLKDINTFFVLFPEKIISLEINPSTMEWEMEYSEIYIREDYIQKNSLLVSAMSGNKRYLLLHGVGLLDYEFSEIIYCKDVVINNEESILMEYDDIWIISQPGQDNGSNVSFVVAKCEAFELKKVVVLNVNSEIKTTWTPRA